MGKTSKKELVSFVQILIALISFAGFGWLYISVPFPDSFTAFSLQCALSSVGILCLIFAFGTWFYNSNYTRFRRHSRIWSTFVLWIFSLWILYASVGVMLRSGEPAEEGGLQRNASNSIVDPKNSTYAMENEMTSDNISNWQMFSNRTVVLDTGKLAIGSCIGFLVGLILLILVILLTIRELMRWNRRRLRKKRFAAANRSAPGSSPSSSPGSSPGSSPSSSPSSSTASTPEKGEAKAKPADKKGKAVKDDEKPSTSKAASPADSKDKLDKASSKPPKQEKVAKVEIKDAKKDPKKK